MTSFKISFFLFVAFFTSTSLIAKEKSVFVDNGIKELNIVSFGAVPDGKTMNTKAIQKAIDFATKAKRGGKVIVPKGVFLTGSIDLKSNVELHVEEGGILLGSTNPEDYVSVSSEGRPKSPKNDDNTHLGLVLSHNSVIVKLSGTGTINGQGRELALTVDSLHHTGVKIDLNYGYANMHPNETVRPKLFSFSLCKEIKIKDLNITSSAGWGLSYELSEDLSIEGIELLNRTYWNNDGMDITDCKNVKIISCYPCC